MPVAHLLVSQQRRQRPLLIGDGVPDDERGGLYSLEHVTTLSDPVEEDTAVASVVCTVVTANGTSRADSIRDEAGKPAGVDEVADESQQERPPVALVVPAAEALAAEEAGPALAGEGGTEEALRLIRRGAEEDLLDDLV